MTTQRLHLVEHPARLRPIKDQTLLNLAYDLWPENDDLRMKWLRAVAYLRTSTKKGWIIDQSKPRLAEPL